MQGFVSQFGKVGRVGRVVEVGRARKMEIEGGAQCCISRCARGRREHAAGLSLRCCSSDDGGGLRPGLTVQASPARAAVQVCFKRVQKA